MSPFPETSPSYSHSIQHVHHFREMRCLKHTMFFARWFNHQGTKELVDSDLAEESRSLSVDPTVNVWWFFDLLQRWHSMAWHGTVVSCLKNGYSMQQIFSSPLSCINQTSIFDPLQFYCAKKTFQKQYVFVWKLATSKSNGLSSCSLCLTAVFGGYTPISRQAPNCFFYNFISLMGHNNPQYGWVHNPEFLQGSITPGFSEPKKSTKVFI